MRTTTVATSNTALQYAACSVVVHSARQSGPRMQVLSKLAELELRLRCPLGSSEIKIVTWPESTMARSARFGLTRRAWARPSGHGLAEGQARLGPLKTGLAARPGPARPV